MGTIWSDDNNDVRLREGNNSRSITSFQALDTIYVPGAINWSKNSRAFKKRFSLWVAIELRSSYR